MWRPVDAQVIVRHGSRPRRSRRRRPCPSDARGPSHRARRPPPQPQPCDRPAPPRCPAASRPAPPGNRAECRAVGRGARRGATAADAPRRRARAGGLPRLPGLRADRPESDGRRRNATAEHPRVTTASRARTRTASPASRRIPYPDAADRAAASAAGAPPGGDIVIHGLRNGFSWVGRPPRLTDWTDGCAGATRASEGARPGRREACAGRGTVPRRPGRPQRTGSWAGPSGPGPCATAAGRTRVGAPRGTAPSGRARDRRCEPSRATTGADGRA